jgi:hypothetical protein
MTKIDLNGPGLRAHKKDNFLTKLNMISILIMLVCILTEVLR